MPAFTPRSVKDELLAQLLRCLAVEGDAEAESELRREWENMEIAITVLGKKVDLGTIPAAGDGEIAVREILAAATGNSSYWERLKDSERRNILVDVSEEISRLFNSVAEAVAAEMALRKLGYDTREKYFGNFVVTNKGGENFLITPSVEVHLIWGGIWEPPAIMERRGGVLSLIPSGNIIASISAARWDGRNLTEVLSLTRVFPEGKLANIVDFYAQAVENAIGEGDGTPPQVGTAAAIFLHTFFASEAKAAEQMLLKTLEKLAGVSWKRLKEVSHATELDPHGAKYSAVCQANLAALKSLPFSAPPEKEYLVSQQFLRNALTLQVTASMHHNGEITAEAKANFSLTGEASIATGINKEQQVRKEAAIKVEDYRTGNAAAEAVVRMQERLLTEVGDELTTTTPMPLLPAAAVAFLRVITFTVGASYELLSQIAKRLKPLVERAVGIKVKRIQVHRAEAPAVDEHLFVDVDFYPTPDAEGDLWFIVRLAGKTPRIMKDSASIPVEVGGAKVILYTKPPSSQSSPVLEVELPTPIQFLVLISKEDADADMEFLVNYIDEQLAMFFVSAVETMVQRVAASVRRHLLPKTNLSWRW